MENNKVIQIASSKGWGEAKMKKNKVFVYGTLRKGEGNHHYLKEAEQIEKRAWVYGKLYDTGYGYPGLIPDPRCKVFGEIFLIDDEEFKKLDLLEDYKEGAADNLYTRMIYQVHGEKEGHHAWVYIYEQKVNENMLIESGDWVLYRWQMKNSSEE